MIELFKNRNHTENLARWYLTNQEFSPTCEYLRGKGNLAADALPRCVAMVPLAYNTLDKEEVARLQLQDPDHWSTKSLVHESYWLFLDADVHF